MERGLLLSSKSIALYQDQIDFLDLDREERGISNFNRYIRWMVDKQRLEKDRLARIDAALDIGDHDAIRDIIGAMLKIDEGHL